MGVFVAINSMMVGLCVLAGGAAAWSREWRYAAQFTLTGLGLFALTVGVVALVGFPEGGE